MLPPDAQAHGFDTNADALGMEPALLDRYLTAAAKIARVAVGDPTLRPAVERYTAVKATRTSRRGSGRPSVSANRSRWGRAAGSRRATTSRWMANTSSSPLLQTYAGVIRGLNGPRRSRFVSMATASGSSRSAWTRTNRPDDGDADDEAAGACGAQGRLRQVLATIVKSEASRPKGSARNACRSGIVKATSPARNSRSRRC